MLLMRVLGRGWGFSGCSVPWMPTVPISIGSEGRTLALSSPPLIFPIHKLLPGGSDASVHRKNIFQQPHRGLHSFSPNILSNGSKISMPTLYNQTTRLVHIINTISCAKPIKSVKSPPFPSATSLVGKCWTVSSSPITTSTNYYSQLGANEDGSPLPPGKATTITLPLHKALQSQEQADQFLRYLSDEQKKILYHSLNIEVQRDDKSGHLGSTPLESANYLSKFGRPTAAIIGGKDEQPEHPPKWLHARLVSADLSIQPEAQDEKSPPVTAKAIWAVGLKNAMPFIGFGFLDNLIMILAGDYIDLTIGAALGISTMAAAALGNTISDVAGIASAWYVEALAEKVGIHDPKLTPSQWNLWSVRWASNIGRAIGVVIGCLLGMVPLLFLPSAEEKKEREEIANALREANKNVSGTNERSQ